MLRKKFLQKVIVSSGGLFTMPMLLQAQKSDGMKRSLTDQLPPDKVKDFVIAGHGDLAKVKTMLQKLPTLLYATWDWLILTQICFIKNLINICCITKSLIA